ncbi:MAG: DNA mismatch repair protein MutS [Clostridiales bacterium]
MIEKMFKSLEFDVILKKLEEYALSNRAKNRIKNLKPFISNFDVINNLNETTEGKVIIEKCGNPPLSSMTELEKSITLAKKEAILIPEQLENVGGFLVSCRRLKSYLRRAETISDSVALYGNSINELSYIEEEIKRSIRGGQVDDRATQKLTTIRRKIITTSERVKTKLDLYLRNNKNWFSESFVSIKNGRYTLPIKKEFKNRLGGTVIDISKSGGTYFIEPSIVSKIHEEIGLLRIDEENEVRRILYNLTSLIVESIDLIKINIEAMEILDFIFAKGKLSIDMKGNPIPVSIERNIRIEKGRHPLLSSENLVPLDFKIGDGINGVVITGPNTGGKTVSLKTVGLLSLMAQSGLHVPAENGVFTMNNHILCDIGDGQSITENLSTFSSHITNIIDILKTSDDQSLILLDELGSGTDPKEGMGLAIAILEELEIKNCLFVATTHYPDVKDYAMTSKKMINARMTFDHQSLLPLYQLKIGEAGFSCALYIAKRLGISERIINKAELVAYGSKNKTNIDFIGNDKTDDEKPKINNVRVKDEINIKEKKENEIKFSIGDCVTVYPQKMTGIVCTLQNKKGELGVQVKDKKLFVNHKRLKIKVCAKDLYPEDYDLSIVFDSVENRKNRKKMSKKHDPNLIVELREPKK